MSEREAFERILASLHEAALDDARLSTASALIDDALGVYGNCMAVGDLHSGEDIQVYLARFFYQGYRHHEFEREYFENYFPLDERLPRLRRFPDSRLYHFSDLFTEKEQKTSVVYNECSTRMLARNRGLLKKSWSCDRMQAYPLAREGKSPRCWDARIASSWICSWRVLWSS